MLWADAFQANDRLRCCHIDWAGAGMNGQCKAEERLLAMLQHQCNVTACSNDACSHFCIRYIFDTSVIVGSTGIQAATPLHYAVQLIEGADNYWLSYGAVPHPLLIGFR